MLESNIKEVNRRAISEKHEVWKVSEIIYLGKQSGYICGDKTTNEPNIGIVFDDTQTILIDAGSSVRHFQRVYTTIEQAKLQPPSTIILTHYHWDHVFAATYYEAVLYAQNLTAAKIEMMHTWHFDDESLAKLEASGHFSSWSAQMIKEHVPGREHLSVKQADIVFNDSCEFTFGESDEIQAIHVGGSHTNDSTIVYVPSDKVLYLGDSLYSSRGAYDRQALWEVIEKIKQLDVEHALLSHREPFNKSEFQAYLASFAQLHELVGSQETHYAVHKTFQQQYKRKPTPDEFYILRGLVNGNIQQRRE